MMQSDKTEIDIYSFINKVDLSHFDLGVFDPVIYYVTSGHAIWKTEKLKNDLCELRKKLQDKKKTKLQATKLTELTTAMTGAIKLSKHLQDLQGDAIFMELEWGSDRSIYVIPKNPRAQKEE